MLKFNVGPGKVSGASKGCTFFNATSRSTVAKPSMLAPCRVGILVIWKNLPLARHKDESCVCTLGQKRHEQCASGVCCLPAFSLNHPLPISRASAASVVVFSNSGTISSRHKSSGGKGIGSSFFGSDRLLYWEALNLNSVLVCEAVAQYHQPHWGCKQYKIHS